MSGSKTLFDCRWDVDKYKSNYDSEHWDLCKAFMETHKTKYPEQKLAHLTEAFYQMGVYGSSYDPKTTRMVNALTIEVLDNVLKSHPGVLHHPFCSSSDRLSELTSSAESESSKDAKEPTQSTSIWDVQVDQRIIANVLVEEHMRDLFKGFVIIYGIHKTSTMIDNKVTILEDSFKRSKFGPCHWAKDDTHNNICPIRMSLKWRNIVLAEAVGSDEKSLKSRLAQAVLSKMSNFCQGIEARWSYYRDGRLPDRFDKPNPRRTHIYRVIGRYQFKDMAEITSYVDTFANSDSFAEVVFGMDFSNQEKKQLMEYVDKNWCTKLTYRMLSKIGVKNKGESHVFIYHIRTGEELRRWLEQTGYENDERYRIVPPGRHRRAGACDDNVREVLTTDAVEKPKETPTKVENLPLTQMKSNDGKEKGIEAAIEKKSDKKEEPKTKDLEKKEENAKEDETSDEKDKYTGKVNVEKDKKDKETSNAISQDKNVKETPKTVSQDDEDDFEKLLDGFVLFYDANKTSEIDKDDWFTALCESFKISKFGPLDVTIENVRPLRTRCVFKLNDRTLASAEGLTETQAKTAATLQLISKLEPFTYIIQAKDEYFCNGKVPPFLEDPEQSQTDFYRLVHRKDLPSYYTIFQTIDEFGRSQSDGEIIFGPDFTWELKNEIAVYLKAKGLSHRYFTLNDQKPWTHMAVYCTVKPEELKEHLLKNGGENDKYKLIAPPKAEPIIYKTSEESKVKSTKESEKLPVTSVAKKLAANLAEKKTEPPSKVAEKKTEPHTKVAEKKTEPPPKLAENETVSLPKVAEKKTGSPLQVAEKKIKPLSKVAEKKTEPPPKVAEKRKQEAAPTSEPLLEEIDCNKIQIKLKKFKVDKVDYPEDTGGDFPGLIIWIGVRKNSVWQKSPFAILIESFKMSKYGELLIEESEETVWSKREPMKKCVIKAQRRVLAVGLGDTKAEAKNSACLQVLRMLRKHCYAIQAKESYFKEGKATPYDFNPDPAKGNIYKVMKRNKFKDRAAMIQYVSSFAKNSCPEEVIFGDDFTYDEREFILDHCRKITLNYRLMKCQSISKNMHTHIAIFHQQPPPIIKAELMKAGGENDKYRLVPPGGLITNQNNQADMWPETLGNEKDCNASETSQPVAGLPIQQSSATPSKPSETKQSGPLQKSPVMIQTSNNSAPIPSLINRQLVDKKGDGNFGGKEFNGQEIKQQMGPKPMLNQEMGPQPMHTQQTGPQPMHSQQMGPQPLHTQPMGPLPIHNQPQFVPVEVLPYQEVPFGPQPLYAPPPLVYNQPVVDWSDQPLQFGPNPPMMHPGMGSIGMPAQAEFIKPLPGNGQTPNNTFPTNQTQIALPSITKTVPNSPPKIDLREELAEKKRQANQKRGLAFSNEEPVGARESTPERIVYDVTDRRDDDGWSRKVFVSKSASSTSQEDAGSKGNFDLRAKLRHKDPMREARHSPPRSNRMRTLSPEAPNSRFGGRGRRPPESDRPREWEEERIIRRREGSPERRIVHDRNRMRLDRFRSRSRSLSPRRPERSPSPTVVYRDLWDNIPAHLSESIFMYKYVKQDSITETDPYALLRATRSLSFNVDFDFIKEQTAIDEWYVSVELITDDHKIHPLVGEAIARTEQEASRLAADHAVDTVQKACRVIQPNFRYFCNGGVPEFIARKHPMKTSVYEIIQNLDPGTPLARYTVEMMFKMFISSDLEDIFFLASDFSYMERVLVVEMATQMNLWWRLFGPRDPHARPDDVVSTQHVCVFKQKSALQLIRELLARGGYTEKYKLIDPREYRLTRPRFSGRGRGNYRR